MSGAKQPIPGGLYDVHGNVLEWAANEWKADHFGREGGVEVEPRAVDAVDLPARR